VGFKSTSIMTLSIDKPYFLSVQLLISICCVVDEQTMPTIVHVQAISKMSR
jgi:hypothetical protein